MSDFKTLNPAPPRDAELVTETRQLTVWWFGWLVQLPTIINALVTALNAGYTGTITTAKLTPAGTTGSMTFTNGILTSQTPAT